MKIKYILIGIFFLSISFARAEKVRVGLPIDVKEIDPFDLNYVEEYEVFGSVHDSLLEYQSIVGLTPVLAERWDFDKKKKTITFRLKRDLKFSDGSKLNALDVEFSYKRLILLDTSNNMDLSKCLKLKGTEKFKNINKNHPLIHVVDNNTITIGPTNCGDEFVKQLGYPNYGIVSKKYIGKDLKLKIGAPVSGAFRFKSNNEGFNLVPNLNNWRWEKAKNKDLVFDFVKINQDFKSIAKKNVDIFRTASNLVLNEALKDNYKVIISIPVMSWFITADEKQITKAVPYFDILNSNIKNRNYKVFENNQLEVPATNFFSKEYQCDPESTIPFRKHQLITKGIVRLMNHKSGESEIFNNDIKNDLERHGIKVLIDNQKLPASSSPPIELYIVRQFMDDDLQTTFNYVYTFFKSIPDPKRKIINTITLLNKDNISSDMRKNLLKKICNDSYLYNYVPLAHRKYAFLYKNEMLKNIFFKNSGNLIYTKIIQ